MIRDGVVRLSFAFPRPITDLARGGGGRGGGKDVKDGHIGPTARSVGSMKGAVQVIPAHGHHEQPWSFGEIAVELGPEQLLLRPGTH